MASQDPSMTGEHVGRDRRRFLRAAAAAGVLGLAGCIQQAGSGDGDGGTNGSGGGGANDSDSGGTNGDGGGGSDESGGGGSNDSGGETNGSGDETADTGGTTVGSGDLGSVTWGILSPLSGPFSALGKTQRQAAKLAVGYVNDSDQFGVEIEAVYEDTQTDPSAARQKAQKLVKQEGVQFLSGAVNSSVALALADFAKANQVVYTSGGAAMALTGENCNEFTFRNETNTAQQAAGMVDYVAANLGTNVWIHTADYAYGNSAIDQIERRIDEQGLDIEVVGTTKPELGTDNFGPYISQISSSNADTLAIPLTGGDLVKFLKQADGQGLKDQVDIIGTAIFAQTIRAGLGSAAAGTYSSTLYNYKLESGDNKQFVDSYRSQYDSPPGSFARVGYESVRMPARGIQEAGSTDPTAVKDALPGLQMTTVLGETQFRECDHQSINPVWTGEMTMPDSGEITDVNLLEKVPGKDATPPCSATQCSF